MYPHKIEELPEGEAYYALTNETVSTGQYISRDGVTWPDTPYIQFIYLGNSEQANAWVQEEEARKHRRPYKIVVMKTCNVVKTVLIDIK